MLVLGRKPTEAICIGDDVKVVVVAIFNNRVRLGIQAPDGTVILRDELVRKPKEDTLNDE